MVKTGEKKYVNGDFESCQMAKSVRCRGTMHRAPAGYNKQWQYIILFFVALWMCACSTVPITGREQLTVIPESQIISLSFDQYRQFLSNHEVVTGTKAAEAVRQVGDHLEAAVETYMNNHGLGGQIENYHWEFSLVKDDSANAFALPGGKVVVFSGILKIAENNAGLATVMGHEIAHVIAKHGNERMSQGLIAQLGGQALSVALKDKPQQTQQLFMTAFGLGAQIGFLLPYSRLQESEADELGLVFMAMAGYDPHAALNFWERMDQQKEAMPPEFLSTHPSHGTRIEDLKSFMPEAMKYYNATSGP